LAIGVDEVRHVAALGRLALPEAELPRYAAELGRILEHAARLQAIDVTGLEPTASALVLGGVVRPDQARPGLPAAEVLGAAPAHHGGMFLVPRVVEG